MLITVAYDYETIYKRPNIDAVLVIDVSHSMRHADPNRLAQEAMKLFVDMLGSYNDRVGVVSYAGHVVDSLPLTIITDQRDKGYIKDFIGQLYYASWTDHSLGLVEAMRILEINYNPDNKQVIILLTDGNTNINPWIERTLADAEYDLYNVVTEAINRGIPIHTIGLNYDGTLDQEYIDAIAKATGGLSFETSQADNLMDIIRAIFKLIESAIIPPDPTPSPSPTQAPSPDPTPIINEYEESGFKWIIVIGLSLAVCTIIVLLIFARNRKRVFSGNLVINITDPITGPVEQILRNMIPYGKKTTLANLLEGRVSPVLTQVKLTPSPNSPSHLPKIIINCATSKIMIRKGFREHNDATCIEISPNEVVSLHLSKENIQIRLKYTC